MADRSVRQFEQAEKPGTVTPYDIVTARTCTHPARTSTSGQRKLKVVVDAGNGMGGVGLRS